MLRDPADMRLYRLLQSVIVSSAVCTVISFVNIGLIISSLLKLDEDQFRAVCPPSPSPTCRFDVSLSIVLKTTLAVER